MRIDIFFSLTRPEKSQFDIVFIIGMDDETFPDYRAVRSGGVELTQEKTICMWHLPDQNAGCMSLGLQTEPCLGEVRSNVTYRDFFMIFHLMKSKKIPKVK